MNRKKTTLLTGLLVLMAASVFSGEPLRIVSYDFTLAKATAQEAAKKIEVCNPDIILLQGVRSWNMCRSLARELRPTEYQIVACSVFEGPGQSGPPQTAILSRHQAVFAWNERAGTNNAGTGYVFAVLRVGSRRIGAFSAQIGRNQQSGMVAHTMVAQMEMASSWVANRPDAFTVGASKVQLGNSVPHRELKRILTEAGFEQVPGLENRLALVRPAGMGMAMPEFEAVEHTNRALLAFQIDLDAKPRPTGSAGKAASKSAQENAPSAKPLPLTNSATSSDRPSRDRAGHDWLEKPLAPLAPTNRGTRTDSKTAPALLPSPGEPPASKPIARSGALHTLSTPYLLVLGLLGTSAVLGGVLLARNRKRKKTRSSLLAPPTDAASSGYLLIAPSSLTGTSGERSAGSHGRMIAPSSAAVTHTEAEVVASKHLVEGNGAEATKAGLIEWLKREFVRRLIHDRSELLETQAVATERAERTRERLAQLEQRLEVQNGIYRQRIEELTRELGAAREENRELIRMRISQVKVEMEAARARVLRESS